MNVFTVFCNKILNRIESKEMTFDAHLKEVENSIRERLDKAEHIIVCGNTKVGKNCMKHLRNITSRPVYMWDLRDGIYRGGYNQAELKALEGNKLYFITSREEVLNYADLIPKVNSDILSFNEIMILDENFGIKNTLFHNRDFAVGAMKSIFDETEVYCEILRKLSDNFSKEIFARLILYRLYFDINCLRNISTKYKPYFDEEIIKLDENEIFVDAGGYIGDTCEDFKEVADDKFKRYYFFEPSKENIAKAKEIHGADERIVWMPKGIADKKGEAKFAVSSSGMYEMTLNRPEKAEADVIALDEINNFKPTFIKIDIEGFECSALDGAERVVRENLPKMAICVYHRPNDIPDIYKRLKSYGYKKFSLRAEAGTLDFDIVMYALV